MYSLGGVRQRAVRRVGPHTLDVSALPVGVYAIAVGDGPSRTVGHVAIVR